MAIGDEGFSRPERRIRPRGVHFPFTKRSDGIPSADIPPNIFISNIKQALLTTQAERVMRPAFGSVLKGLVFNPIPSPFFEEAIRTEVRRVIQQWEPRVSILDIEVTLQETLARVRVKLLSSFGQGEVDLSFHMAT